MAKNFLPSDLLNKSANAEVQKIFEYSFEYLLAGVAEAHFQAKRFSTFSEFNDENIIQRSLILSYPFFVSLSNGHANSLYNLFGNFLSYSSGPASIPVRELIPLDKETGIGIKELNFFKINGHNITIKNCERFNNNFDELKDEIRVFKNDPQDTSLNDVALRNDKETFFTPICKLIDNGIDIIKNRSSRNFFDGDTKRVLDLSYKYETWLKNYASNTLVEMKYEDVISQPLEKRPFYNVEYA